MRTYETMLLLDARLQDAEIDEKVERFHTLVGEQGGEIVNTDRWGRRRLAYEIEDQTEGYYAVITYQMPPEGLKPVAEALPFIEGLVRSKTVRPEARTRGT